MATLYLIRHGEPEQRGVFLGQMDPPLSVVGRMQAASSLEKIEVAIAYTSPLRRARETAEYVGSPQTVIMEGLREIDFGEWTGKTWREIESGWSELARLKAADWLGIAAPGGESWRQFLNRIETVWHAVRTGPAPAAVVGHQAVNAALAHLIDGMDPLVFEQQYGEVTLIDYGNH
ncbi:MAG: histidine phosphatase family protein [Acidobacteriota bacterium]|nr:histidine phosphatase family protein [Acidobacteriota bacterium]